MPVSPVNPPTTLSSQRLVTLVTSPSPYNWVDGWGYPPNQFGGVNSVGARLKHRTNIFNDCNLNPYQDLLANLYIKWLTFSFLYPRSAGHNVAIEMVPNPTWGRIRPDLNGGAKQWVQLNFPTGRVVPSYIASNGVSVDTPPTSDVLDNGRKMRVPHDWIMHPWPSVSNNSGNEVCAVITDLVSQDPEDPYADSKLDCIVCDWWLRLVPFDEGQGFNHDFTSNPVIVVASGDPYVNGPPRRNGTALDAALLSGSQCVSGVAASCVVELTTEWQQVGYFTSTQAADLHTTLPYSGISVAEFLSAVPPGYDTNTIPPDVPEPDPPVARPSVGTWFPKLTSGNNTWTTAGASSTPPTSLDNDETGDEMLLQQSAATAAKRTIIFRAVDATDGYTAETGLSWGAGDIKISKNGAAEANHSGTVTEIGGGLYKYEFALAELDTLGAISFRTNKSGVRPTSFIHQVVAFDPTNANSLGISYIDTATSTRLAQASYENTDTFLDKANAIETGVTPRGALRLMLAVLAGKLSGAGTTTEIFRNGVADTKARVTATVDTSGNRTAITTDQT